MLTLDSQDPLALAVTGAVRGGELVLLGRLLEEHPGLARARIVEGREGCGPGGRSLLHVVADWPGHFPEGPRTVAALAGAGSDPGARFSGAHAETPLHWAASSNDIAVLDALVAAGADIEADGAVIGGGTPLADACGFGQWEAAYRLVELGARTTLDEAAALGLLDRVEGYVTGSAAPTPDEITRAFWGACHGGQLATVQYLLARGAHLDQVGHGGMTPLDIARAQEEQQARGARDVVAWLIDQGAHTGAEISE
ncbi:ankyrin repeat domain-containing protein [Streptomyces sp. NPDC086835]|uniref:ankyrin repeat domain-containing protein n=1 Tax=Streptomyces sp. NPDC086835 TaxID=3365761 RepID=UPI00381FA771